MKVLGARCIVKEEKKEQKTSVGIIVKGREKEPTYKGKVLSVGSGALLENGTRIPMEVKVGDEVIYTAFSGSPINIDGNEYIIINERDILCILD